MKRSTQRILTTHVGSLPRPPDLLQMIQAKERGEPLHTEAFARRVASAVAEVVRKQAESGIDIVADGEMGRFGFIPYVNERLAGIEPRNNAGRAKQLDPISGIFGVPGVVPMGLANAGRPEERRRRNGRPSP